MTPSSVNRPNVPVAVLSERDKPTAPLSSWKRAAYSMTKGRWPLLALIILLLIIFGFWFIFSGEVWYLVEFLENSLYPTFDAP